MPPRQPLPQPGPAGRQDKVADLLDRAAAQVRLLTTGADWQGMLRLAAHLPGCNFTNVQLVAAQRASATAIASYRGWQARGRQVRKGELAIQLIATGPADAAAGKAGSRTRVVGPPQAVGNCAAGIRYVWDISQTDQIASGSQTVPMAVATADGLLPGLWDALTWLARRRGFAVDRHHPGPGCGATTWESRRIQIRPDLSRAEAAMTLMHELGHVLACDGVTLAGSTADCRGVRQLEADSIAYVVAVRLGMEQPDRYWPQVASWAGTDSRAGPHDTIRTAGTRIIAAATTISQHLDAVLDTNQPWSRVVRPARHSERSQPGRGELVPIQQTSVAQAQAGSATLDTTVAADPAEDRSDRGEIGRVLVAAEQFYLDHLDGSWVPGYLTSRGLSRATSTLWRAGYAPHGWTALLNHLRNLGHDDQVIEAAGLARRSSRGTLIDHFRDRVMFAIRDEHGTIAGFIGRTHPQAGSDVPKYLNSPETQLFRKSSLLFGLHQARDNLAHGAIPVMTEGPFDAIAISTAAPGRYAGLAPCGTALTAHQVAALSRLADLPKSGVLVALDGDRAGRQAAIKAHPILLPAVAMPGAVILPANSDPASILQSDGPAALRELLHRQVRPLAEIVIDAQLDTWAERLDHPEGRLAALRAAADLIASQLPAETATKVLAITGGHDIATLDDHLQPIARPELPAIARALPASATCQIARIAERLDTEYSEVTTAVANAIAAHQLCPQSAARAGPPAKPKPLQPGPRATTLHRSAPASLIGRASGGPAYRPRLSSVQRNEVISQN